MAGEQVHAPLPTNNAAQAVVATTKIDWLDREIDPNARWQREQRLPQPADYGGDVRGIAALLEAKPKAGAELELYLLRSGAGQPHRQQRQGLALHRGRARRLVQVILQRGVRDAVFSGNRNARDRTFFRFRYDRCPKFSSARWCSRHRARGLSRSQPPGTIPSTGRIPRKCPVPKQFSVRLTRELDLWLVRTKCADQSVASN